MPELPEVEVTRRGIAPRLTGATITDIVVREPCLRWPVPSGLGRRLAGARITRVERRGKYLILAAERAATPLGWLILHLGMSGSLRFVAAGAPATRHEHVDLVAGDHALRLTDPRRFGAVLWHPAASGALLDHPLLRSLGVEPLTDAFTADLLFEATRGKRVSIKQALLAGDIVVGVGNIYASESLFRAGIRPQTAAGRIGLARYARLVPEIRAVLEAAIARGGSTLRDFHADDAPGYFQLDAMVYDREGLPCRVCGRAIRRIVQGQRSTFYCARCQR